MTRRKLLPGGILFVVLVAVLLRQLPREIGYDESIYLAMTHSMLESGFPTRISSSSFPKRYLFTTSPPGALVPAMISEAVSPRNLLQSRIVHFLLLTVPLILLTWRIAHREYGPGAGLATMLLYIFSAGFIEQSIYVQLENPLALIGLITIWATYRACEPDGDLRLAASAGLCLGIAVWIKYQSVTVPVAFLAYVGVLWGSRQPADWGRVKRTFWSLLAGGAVGLTSLIVYFSLHSGGTFFRHLRSNSERIEMTPDLYTTPSNYWLAISDSVSYLGIVFVLLCSLACLAPRRRITLIMACYVLIVVLFNVGSPGLPGAGNRYLIQAVPAMIILGAGGIAAAWSGVRRRWWRPVIVGTVCLGLCFSPPWRVDASLRDEVAELSQQIRRVCPSDAGLAASIVGFQYYTGRPMILVQFTKKQVLLSLLQRTESPQLSYVVFDRDLFQDKPRDHWPEFRKVLQADFEEEPGSARYRLYRRKNAPSIASFRSAPDRL